MKNQKLFGVLALAGIMTLAGCGGGTTSGGCTSNCGGGGGTLTITAITGATTVQVGVTTPYSNTCTISTGTCTWTSSDPNTLAINATTGAITPSTATTGDVTITATASTDTSVTFTKKVHVVNQIVYQQVVANPGLMIVNVGDGSTTQVQTGGANVIGYNPAFFYDHQLILYTPNDASNNELAIMATDGTVNGTTTNPEMLTFPNLVGVAVGRPSPDGKTIVFVGQNATTGFQGYYSVSATGGTPTLLYENSNNKGIGLDRPAWSHDGKYILHNRVTGGVSDLWIMNADGSGTRQITWAKTSGYFGVGAGTFSLDNTEVYFSLYETGANGSLYSIAANNADQNDIGIPTGGIGGEPGMSPNGQFISLGDNGGDGISVFDINSLAETSIVSGQGGISYPSW